MGKRVLHDKWFKLAKEEGYLSRAAYKLKQIERNKRLFRGGMQVLDLGCAPGAWLQVAREFVGPRGVVVGLDLQPVNHAFDQNVHHFVGDAFAFPTDTLKEAAGGRFDIVLSDMAPNTIGHGDAERSVTMGHQILEIVPELLKADGHLVFKVLEGSGFPELLAASKKLFQDCRPYKPPASRDVSREIYIVGTGFKRSAAPDKRPEKKRIPPHLRFTEEELRGD